MEYKHSPYQAGNIISSNVYQQYLELLGWEEVRKTSSSIYLRSKESHNKKFYSVQLPISDSSDTSYDQDLISTAVKNIIEYHEDIYEVEISPNELINRIQNIGDDFVKIYLPISSNRCILIQNLSKILEYIHQLLEWCFISIDQQKIDANYRVVFQNQLFEYKTSIKLIETNLIKGLKVLSLSLPIDNFIQSNLEKDIKKKYKASTLGRLANINLYSNLVYLSKVSQEYSELIANPKKAKLESIGNGFCLALSNLLGYFDEGKFYCHIYWSPIIKFQEGSLSKVDFDSKKVKSIIDSYYS